MMFVPISFCFTLSSKSRKGKSERKRHCKCQFIVQSKANEKRALNIFGCIGFLVPIVNKAKAPQHNSFSVWLSKLYSKKGHVMFTFIPKIPFHLSEFAWINLTNYCSFEPNEIRACSMFLIIDESVKQKNIWLFSMLCFQMLADFVLRVRFSIRWKC